MKAHTIFWLPLALLALAALTPTMKVGSVSQADEQPPPDVSKLSIEMPLKIVVASSADLPTNTPRVKDSPLGAPLDVRKSLIETPLKIVVADVEKGRIELPLKIVVADSLEAPADTPPFDLLPEEPTEPVAKAVVEAAPKRVVSTDSTSTPTEDSSKSSFTNPQVSPGNVRWHDSFADAQAASETSGKPILLFQLLGRLDQRFT